MRPMTRIGALLVITLLTIGTRGPITAQHGHSPSPVATPAPASAWTVTETREIVVDGTPVTLSPDGQWIAGIGPDPDGIELCVWAVATLEPTCDTEELLIHAESIAWAPDSSAVAYSSNAAEFLEESDIAVFELESGTIANLTDDGFDDNAMSLGEEAKPVDIMPAWALDSQSLTFVRSVTGVPGDTTDLMTIERAGGEPEHLHAVSGEVAFAIYTPMRILADGMLLYALTLPDGDDPDSGIWALNEVRAAQVFPGHHDAEYPFPVIIDVWESSEGIIISGYSREHFIREGIAGSAFLTNLSTGAATAVEHPDGSGLAASPPRFSPDGTSRIGLELQVDSPHLVIRTSDSSTELGAFDTTEQAFDRGIDWAANDTILVLDSGNVILIAVARNG